MRNLYEGNCDSVDMQNDFYSQLLSVCSPCNWDKAACRLTPACSHLLWRLSGSQLTCGHGCHNRHPRIPVSFCCVWFDWPRGRDSLSWWRVDDPSSILLSGLVGMWFLSVHFRSASTNWVNSHSCQRSSVRTSDSFQFVDRHSDVSIYLVYLTGLQSANGRQGQCFVCMRWQSRWFCRTCSLGYSLLIRSPLLKRVSRQFPPWPSAPLLFEVQEFRYASNFGAVNFGL